MQLEPEAQREVGLKGQTAHLSGPKGMKPGIEL